MGLHLLSRLRALWVALQLSGLTFKSQWVADRMEGTLYHLIH